MIVPISLVSTQRMQKLRNFLESKDSLTYISNYADRPGTLFNGVHQKLCILITNSWKKQGLFTTNFLHWSSVNERKNLFDTISYTKSKPYSDGVYPKIGMLMEQEISKKINIKTKNLSSLMSIVLSSNKPLYLNMRLMFWVKCFLVPQKSREF